MLSLGLCKTHPCLVSWLLLALPVGGAREAAELVEQEGTGSFLRASSDPHLSSTTLPTFLPSQFAILSQYLQNQPHSVLARTLPSEV